MTRTVYDSTNIYDDPAGAHMVAYYIDGAYAVNAATVRARFPTAVLIPISAVGTDAGTVGDVEPGCMTVPQSIVWVKLRRLAHADPTIYCNEMNAWAGIRQAFRNAGVVEPHYWVADYDGIASVPAGAVAKQYANPPLTHGHFDMSVALDVWPGVDTQGDSMDLSNPLDKQLIDDVKAIKAQFTGPLATDLSIDARIKALEDFIVALPKPTATVDTAAIAAAVTAALVPPQPSQETLNWLAEVKKFLRLP